MRIQFEAGTSRYGNYGVNYLISDDNDLYAEVRVPEDASDDYGYLVLKAEILRQAEARGIPSEYLSFWCDGQEWFLAVDAAAGEARS